MVPLYISMFMQIWLNAIRICTLTVGFILFSNYCVALKSVVRCMQCEPENSGLGRRILDSSYDFKKFNEHDAQQFTYQMI